MADYINKITGKSLEKRFFEAEMSDFNLYRLIAEHEKSLELKDLVTDLMHTELRHAKIWAALSGEDPKGYSMPISSRVKLYMYLIARRLMGIAFVTKLLERNEKKGLYEYKGLMKRGISSKLRTKVGSIIKDEEEHESMLLKETEKHEARLDYTRSIVFGMNDGLVEILAVVSGLAMIASSSFIVAITGIIVGISGTLSMAAGAYLSSKSEIVIDRSLGKGVSKPTKPIKDAYYTGAFYFSGALVATYPFILGASGYLGIAEAAISVIIILSIASTLIAVISDTGIKHRILEMLAISLGTAFITALIGFLIKVMLGIVIS